MKVKVESTNPLQDITRYITYSHFAGKPAAVVACKKCRALGFISKNQLKKLMEYICMADYDSGAGKVQKCRGQFRVIRKF